MGWWVMWRPLWCGVLVRNKWWYENVERKLHGRFWPQYFCTLSNDSKSTISPDNSWGWDSWKQAESGCKSEYGLSDVGQCLHMALTSPIIFFIGRIPTTQVFLPLSLSVFFILSFTYHCWTTTIIIKSNYIIKHLTRAWIVDGKCDHSKCRKTLTSHQKHS